MREEWKNFKEGKWCEEINVSNFIKENYKGYEGDESFLASKTEKTGKVWSKCEELLKEELKKHVLDIDTDHMSGINAYEAGYIDKENEVIVGLQTDAPLKRIVNPYGGIRMVYKELDAYGYKLNPTVDKYFNEFYPKTNTLLDYLKENTIIFLDEIEKIKTNGINEKHINRIKKMIYGNYVREYDDVSEVARMFISDYFKGINSFDYIEEYNQVTKEFAEQILKDIFNEEKMVISIVEKK